MLQLEMFYQRSGVEHMGSLLLNVSGWVCESQDIDSLFDDTDFSLSCCRKQNLKS